MRDESTDMTSSTVSLYSQLSEVWTELRSLPRVIGQSLVSLPPVDQFWRLLVTALRKSFSVVGHIVRLVRNTL